jgi:hypothetical protein
MTNYITRVAWESRTASHHGMVDDELARASTPISIGQTLCGDNPFPSGLFEELRDGNYCPIFVSSSFHFIVRSTFAKFRTPAFGS